MSYLLPAFTGIIDLYLQHGENEKFKPLDNLLKAAVAVGRLPVSSEYELYRP